MIQINIYETKKNFSAILKRVQAGETIIISSHNKPIAELSPIKKQAVKKRPLGLAKGDFTVPDDFNDPLPDEILDAFEGREAFEQPQNVMSPFHHKSLQKPQGIFDEVFGVLKPDEAQELLKNIHHGRLNSPRFE
ncbi:MAG TPA: hypothetical protein DDW49_06065 [Deltaproteobacteria bacterium]|nr:MAG: hypothetical protein A2048_07670 [Deltaproteobacteria bacterium GWA2_45_12]HBF12938.1 hypothetical protein [Deltaproteobacteria bacterium]